MLVSKIFKREEIAGVKNPFHAFEMQLKRVPETHLSSMDDIKSIKIPMWSQQAIQSEIEVRNVLDEDNPGDCMHVSEEYNIRGENDYTDFDKMITEWDEGDPSFQIESFFDETFPEPQNNSINFRERYFGDLSRAAGDESKIDNGVLNAHKQECAAWIGECSDHVDRNPLHPYQNQIKACLLAVAQYAELAKAARRRCDDHENMEELQFAFLPEVGKNPVTYEYNAKFAKIVECVLAMKKTNLWVQSYSGTLQRFVDIRKTFMDSWNLLGQEDTAFHYYLRWLQYESKGIHVPDYMPSAHSNLFEFVKIKQQRFHNYLEDWRKSSSDPRHGLYHTAIYFQIRPAITMAKRIQVTEIQGAPKITFKFIFSDDASKWWELCLPSSHEDLMFTLMLLYNSPLYFAYRKLEEFEYLFDIYDELVKTIKRLVASLGK